MNTRIKRTEAQVIHACDRVVESFEGQVVRLMPGRRDGQHDIGLPRRRYYIAGVALWWVPRSDWARISRAHYEFLYKEWVLNQVVGAGDEAALRRVARLCRDHAHRDDVMAVAWREMLTVLVRGLNK